MFAIGTNHQRVGIVKRLDIDFLNAHSLRLYDAITAKQKEYEPFTALVSRETNGETRRREVL